MNIKQFEFRKLDREGLKTLVNWALNEGWNPGPYDAEVFWNTDPDGFYGFFHEGTLVAGGSIISYDGEFGFMGLFIVKPEWRGKGIGNELWYHRRDLLLTRLHEGATIGMDGVVDMQPFYEKGGFEIQFKDERYEKYGEEFQVHPNVTSIEDQNLDTILKYDQQCFGFSRPQFLKPWLQIPDSNTFQYLEGSELKGFAVVRRVAHGHKIGPLFADNFEVAEELYKACLNSAVGEPLYLDIPMVNPAAVKLVKKYKAEYVFECARMYYGSAPSVEMDKIFGITTFELG